MPPTSASDGQQDRITTSAAAVPSIDPSAERSCHDCGVTITSARPSCPDCNRRRKNGMTRAEEDRKARTLREQGATWGQIAAELGISSQAVHGRYRREPWARLQTTPPLPGWEAVLDELVITPYNLPDPSDDYLRGMYFLLNKVRAALPKDAKARLLQKQAAVDPEFRDVA